MVSAELAYSPTPRTRFTADVSHRVVESTVSTTVTQTASELGLRAQHEFTKKIMAKVDAHFREKVLLEQMYIKDPSLSINNLVESAIQKFGEKTEVGRFVRFSVN